jgi:peptide/nickel transport system ATP-binding protein
VRERHKRVEPELEPVLDDPGHEVACLLSSDIRKRIWRELRAGATPDEARAAVRLEALEEEPA